MGEASNLRHSFDESPAIAVTGKIMVAAIIVLFLVIVFVLFLHLYAKWFWWRRLEDQANPSRRTRRRFVFTPGQEPAAAAQRKGLDPSVLRSLPVIVFQPTEFKDGLECSVCLCELSQGEKARLLPKCNHGFHVDCIDMWFQSHSTCPLCRDPIAAELASDSVNPELPELIHHQSPDQQSSGTESPNFPTNVLFWGNQAAVSSGGGSSPEERSPSQPTCSSSDPSKASSSRQDGMLVIDIPRQMTENFASASPSAVRHGEEEVRSPMTTRLRSLKRLLSMEKRVALRSPRSVEDAEQAAGRAQCSKSTSDV